MLPELKKTPETEKEYKRMKALAEGYAIILEQPRCVICAKCDNGYCNQYLIDVPSDQLYKIIDCEHYDEPIPF